MVSMRPAENEFLEKLTEITEINLADEQFGVSELAREVSMSRSNLHRKVKAITGKSVSRFIQNVRLNKAMTLLKQGSSTISEVAFECGFHSVSYFSKCFHDQFGHSPGQAGKAFIDKHDPDIVQQRDAKPRVSRKQHIIVVTSAITLILAVFVLFLILRPFADKQPLDKSIAVLPFINDSPAETEMYFINGTMDAILNNLSKIEDLRVPGRISVEQYRDNPKPIPVIAEELNVSYILEGSGLKHGDKIRLSVQLIDAINDRHIWSGSYNREMKEVFQLYSDIAQVIAAEIEVRITPDEKRHIDKAPTTDLTAYDFFQRGMEEHAKYESAQGGRSALERAENLFAKALEYDSTFAQAYTGLALVYMDKKAWQVNVTEFFDTILNLADIALSHDDQLAEAYWLRGFYYLNTGLTDKGIEELDKAIRYNPNYWRAYETKGKWFIYEDLVLAIDNFSKAASLNRGPELPGLFQLIAWTYTCAGFPGKARYYIEEKFKLDGDTSDYHGSLGYIEFYLDHFDMAGPLFEKAYAMDPDRVKNIQFLGEYYLFTGQYEKSLTFFKKWVEESDDYKENSFMRFQWVGYAYWKNGNRDKAENCLNEIIDFWKRLNEVEGSWDWIMHYDLAGVHAFKGDKDRAYEHLRLYTSKNIFGLWEILYIKHDPLFDPVRDENDFQELVREMETKYQAEHERVRKWLEDQKML